MHIHKVASDAIRTDAVQRVQSSATPQATTDPIAPPRGTDEVQLSEAGLALASDGTTTDSTSSLDPSRADQIRSNILSGAYNSLGMADQVARAVIRSGDL